jgi:peroxiredoxin
MAPTFTRNRPAPGDTLAAHLLFTVDGPAAPLPDPATVIHLQMRRFAGCPVCNRHLRSVALRHDEIVAAGVKEVVVFHSSAEELRPHVEGLPFAVVPDPDKELYRELGVEETRRAVLDPRAWPAMAGGIARSLMETSRGRHPMPALDPEGGRYTVPADLLVDRDGTILAVHYGSHADDQWSVDQLLEQVRQAGHRRP